MALWGGRGVVDEDSVRQCVNMLDITKPSGLTNCWVMPLKC